MPSTPPSLPPSRDVKRPPVRIGWNRSIDRSIRQTDRQTDRQTVSVTVTKKKTLTGDDSNPLEIRGFFLSIDRSDRSIPDRNPIETRDLLRGTRSIRFDPIGSRSIRVRFGIDIDIDSIGRANRSVVFIDRTPTGLRFDGRCDGSGEPSVGRSVDSRSFVIHIIGWIHRPHRPVSGDADARTRGRDRPVRFVERFVERFD